MTYQSLNWALPLWNFSNLRYWLYLKSVVTWFFNYSHFYSLFSIINGNKVFFFKRGILQYENRPKSPPDTKSTFMPGDYFHSSTTARRLGMWTIRCPVIFHNQICHMMDNAPAQFWILLEGKGIIVIILAMTHHDGPGQTSPWIIIDFSVIFRR